MIILIYYARRKIFLMFSHNRRVKINYNDFLFFLFCEIYIYTYFYVLKIIVNVI